MTAPDRPVERGATLITVALSITALLGVSSLSIDGGRMFSARRQAQNATDAAASAGAEALFAYQYAAATNDNTRVASSVYQSTVDKLTQNSMSAASCQLVDAAGVVVTPCASATDADLVAASGVLAGATLTQRTMLAGVMGLNTFNARASATAEVQPLVSASAPFIVCGASDTGWNMLSNDGTIDVVKALRLGQIPVQGAQVPTCGAPSNSFKGKAALNSGPGSIGALMGVTVGNGFNAVISSTVAGLIPCPDLNTGTIPAGGCGMIIPIASGAQGGASGTQMVIANLGVFNVVPGPTGTGKFLGTFVVPSTIAQSGPGAFGVHCATGTQICVVKLVQ
ncbi:MAG: hypothetical protein NVSMB16_00730 [Acidimicrobiales bacterium]